MTRASPRPNLAIGAYRHLKRDIIRGVYAPGEKLRMSDLKTRYDLGVGPMREALSQLVGERLVTTVSQRGYRVAEMSIKELEELYDARAQLEGLILELAIARGGDDWEAEILAKAHALSKVVEVHSAEDMLEVWDRRHQAFHSAIATGCDSPHLLQARTWLFDQAERYRHLWLCQTVFSDAALDTKRREHAALTDTILARDTAAARARMREHLMSPVPIIKRVLQQRGLA
ncbi:GntR family transcriptional regulator [Chromohalobacter marismortui]|uniref:GntR family transcriptional regulator n=1 Tax=Chromohalobacter marismortui TaxID=42055 RepID=A0A4R7NR04_9GAMM|nr:MULTISPECIES: DNA-binding transcriptional regulator CsiR [Chromohalobacter]MCI0508817.1 DNA-binding transcriptional regulator CsiR [Chromohalobacter sp.]MCI0594326.1 DNA-binding transcriptional regulator CsiR [Chromohalobacter sp.]TDU22810.1 GntR family transcriptional regulator [Chromohalobacter marismortui]